MSASDIIDKLKEAFPADQVLFKGVEAYEERNSSYLSRLESDITPKVIILPKSSTEVSEFLKLVQPYVEEGVTFAIRGAGQQPLPGCANIQNAITLDLALLDGVRVDDGVVSIGAGERWGAVYNELSKQGLGVTGARSGNNGVGGLALSGKYMDTQHIITIRLGLTYDLRRSFLLRFSRGLRLRQRSELRGRSGLWQGRQCERETKF